MPFEAKLYSIWHIGNNAYKEGYFYVNFGETVEITNDLDKNFTEYFKKLYNERKFTDFVFERTDELVSYIKENYPELDPDGLSFKNIFLDNANERDFIFAEMLGLIDMPPK